MFKDIDRCRADFATAKASKHPLERVEVGCLIYLKSPSGKHLKTANILFGI